MAFSDFRLLHDKNYETAVDASSQEGQTCVVLANTTVANLNDPPFGFNSSLTPDDS